MNFALFFCFLSIFYGTDSAKILFVAPMAAHSHFTINFRLAKELADRNHQVTIINPYPQKTPIKNYRDISVEEIGEYIDELRKELLNWDKMGAFGNAKSIVDMGVGITKRTFEHPNVQKLLDSEETFDLVIAEQFVSEALLGLGHRFGAPMILLNSIPSHYLNNYLFANPAPSSYVPNLSGPFTKHMNFWERLENFYINMLTALVRELYYLPRQKELFKKHIKSDIELDDVIYNISLMLTNSHVSFYDAVPHVPSIIEIGGYHVSPPKPLPQNLQEFLDKATEGVVLFSMGSNLKSKDLAPESRKAILEAFAGLKQKVLWKFEAELPEAPSNVKIMKWLPQQDILAHPNVKAFITHGGMLSTIEAVYFGVPVIGIPVYGDQKNNIAAAVNNGYGISVPLTEITKEKLSWALDEILNNPKYRQNVEERSRLMHDQPMKPIDTAVFWVEHVIRHRGAPHLRSAGLDLKWYQREMVDIVVFIVGSLVMGLAILFIVIKRLANCVCQKSACKKIKIKKH